jgi:hypothetical protein
MLGAERAGAVAHMQGGAGQRPPLSEARR